MFGSPAKKKITERSSNTPGPSSSYSSDLSGSFSGFSLASRLNHTKPLSTSVQYEQPSVEFIEQTSFKTDTGDANFLGKVAIAGRRRQMEDAISAVPGFLSIQFDNGEYSTTYVHHFFGVYHGFGGLEAAELCKKQLHVAVTDEVRLCLQCGPGLLNSTQWRKVMSCAFAKVRSEFRSCFEWANQSSPSAAGSTAVVIVLNIHQIIIANSGDSRAVLSRAGLTIPLYDYKRKQVESGELLVLAEPEIECLQRSGEDEFFILASHGLWDVITPEAACEVVRLCLTMRGDVTVETRSEFAAAFLVKLALARGSHENISVVVVDLKLGS